MNTNKQYKEEVFYSAIVIIVLILVIALTYNSVLTTKENIEKAKAGLEECPNPYATTKNNTIWVKSCENFLKIAKKQ